MSHAGFPRGFDAGTPRSSTADVLAFATMMITMHSQSNAVIAAFGIAPVPSPVEETLNASVLATLQQLAPLSGNTFDLAYAQAQVAAHQHAESTVLTQLILSAQSPALADYLSATPLPKVQQHLLLAMSLVAELTDAGAADAGSLDAGPADGSADATSE